MTGSIDTFEGQTLRGWAYLAAAESAQLHFGSFDELLRYVFEYDCAMIIEVFQVVERLHGNGWSFGKDHLKFNRTLDVFYISQLATASIASADVEDGEYDQTEFDQLYARYYEWLQPDTWKQYYSPSFLTNPSSAQFYRLPDLQDLPDSNDSTYRGRSKGPGHHIKLPRWAFNVANTHHRQPTLSTTMITEIALDTLRNSILSLQQEFATIVPYSKTQASFWLKEMGLGGKRSRWDDIWRHNQFGAEVAHGSFDMWAWEAYYSPKHWHYTTEVSVADEIVEPDLDGINKHSLFSYGWPDGGTTAIAHLRGWVPELGSEEEVAFLAAVAVKETEGVDDICELNYSIRSHLLLGIMHAAFAMDQEQAVQDIAQKAIASGRLDKGGAEGWINKALKVMKPYTDKIREWPTSHETRSKLLLDILENNGQLFGRWKPRRGTKQLDFELKPTN